MTHGSLFNGIGGFMLAAEWMGWENIFSVEKDEWCNKVSKKNFPNVKQYGDIKTFKGQPGSVDILTGGFPCQPFSHAGKRKGKSDDRWLWPEYLRVIREIKPTYVVGENVAGLITMEDGKTLDGIFIDLEGEGYTIESFIIPACSVGAWHRRDRIWILAYTSDCTNRTNSGPEKKEEGIQEKHREAGRTRVPSGASEDVPDTPGSGIESVRERKNQTIIRTRNKDVSDTRLQRQEINEKQTAGIEQYGKDVPHSNNQGSQGWDGGELQKCSNKQLTGKGNTQHNDSIWESEPAVGRVAHGIPKRVDRLKGLGNAIVPQVAYELFKAIEQVELNYRN